jgi:KAP family P-loop domain
MDKDKLFERLIQKALQDKSLQEITNTVENLPLDVVTQWIEEDRDKIQEECIGLIEAVNKRRKQIERQLEDFYASNEVIEIKKELEGYDLSKKEFRKRLLGVEGEIMNKKGELDKEEMLKREKEGLIAVGRANKTDIVKYQDEKKKHEERIKALGSEISNLREKNEKERYECNAEISNFTRLEELLNNEIIKMRPPSLVAEIQLLNDATKEIEDFIINRLKENLTQALNTKIQFQEGDDLPSWFSAWGISEVFNSKYEIPTIQKEKLSSIIENMGGGSIGISGPRGAGKSTLIWSFCREDFPGKLKGRKVLSVGLSAPVKYETRDFTLYVFSSICNLILQTKSTSEKEYQSEKEFKLNLERESESKKYPLEISLFNNLYQLLGKQTLWTASILGYFLISASLIMANFSISQKFLQSSSSSMSNSLIPVQSRDPSKSLSPPTLIDYSNQLGIRPDSLLTWGIVMLFLGVGVPALSQPRNTRDFFQKKSTSDSNEIDESNSSHLETISSNLIEEAQLNLNTIKFQQSFTSGWSGSLKFPALLETSMNKASTLSKLQLTFPEIIYKYKQFIKQIINSQECVLIVGIDELDKLDDEKVQVFLNDIKALFGIENCYYLISVSEDAMSSFERRGIPFRDAFDSTFDTIIRVNYLSIEEAKNFINKRVIGLPRSMFYFIYCLSNGLARDLIRSCRNVIESDRELSSKNVTVKSSSIYGQMIAQDIESKIISIYIEAKKVTMESDAVKFLEVTCQLELAIQNGLSSKILLDTCEILSTKYVSTEITYGKELECLRTEFLAYLYYMTTLFEIFAEGKCLKLLDSTVESISSLSKLVKARQFFAVNVEFACLLISDFRKGQKLETI